MNNDTVFLNKNIEPSNEALARKINAAIKKNPEPGAALSIWHWTFGIAANGKCSMPNAE
jgi:hypothetical protein